MLTSGLCWGTICRANARAFVAKEGPLNGCGGPSGPDHAVRGIEEQELSGR